MKSEPKMTAPNPPPVPEGQQAPPMRAAASDSRRSLHGAHGSLPLTSGTASQRSKAQDGKTKTGARCFYEGYRAGYRGQPLHALPYPAGTVESASWAGGWIEGKERRREDTRKLDENREP